MKTNRSSTSTTAKTKNQASPTVAANPDARLATTNLEAELLEAVGVPGDADDDPLLSTLDALEADMDAYRRALETYPAISIENADVDGYLVRFVARVGAIRAIHRRLGRDERAFRGVAS